MEQNPKLERIGAALADISRKRMLCALMDGRAHTGKELAEVAGVTAATASAHFAMLRDASFILSEKRGRSTYHRLAGPQIAAALEGLAVLVPHSFAGRLRAVGRHDPGHAEARCCYDHIAGRLGVALCASLVAQDAVVLQEGIALAGSKPGVLAALAGVEALPGSVLGRTCLDWSERRDHLSGRLGRAMLAQALTQSWLKRPSHGRALILTAPGRAAFAAIGLPEWVDDPEGQERAAGGP